MPEPIGPRSPEPATIDLEPVLITGRLREPPPDPELDLAQVALGCAEKISATAVALLAATSSAPVAGILGALQAGEELGICIGKAKADAREQASIQRALTECAEDGGTAVGIIQHEVSCLVVEP